MCARCAHIPGEGLRLHSEGVPIRLNRASVIRPFPAGRSDYGGLRTCQMIQSHRNLIWRCTSLYGANDRDQSCRFLSDLPQARGGEVCAVLQQALRRC